MVLVYSLILHPIRRELGLTFLQYAIADSIYHLSHGGWCTASQAYFAGLFDCERRTIMKNIEVLESLDLVVRIPDQRGKKLSLRTTEKWREYAVERKAEFLSGLSQKVTGNQSLNVTPPVTKSDNTSHKMRQHISNTNNEPDNDKHTPPHAKAGENIPPLKEEVLAFFNELGAGCDPAHVQNEAERFWNYFESSGWRLSGGRGGKMKNWQAAARNWFRKDGPPPPIRQQHNPPPPGNKPGGMSNLLDLQP